MLILVALSVSQDLRHDLSSSSEIHLSNSKFEIYDVNTYPKITIPSFGQLIVGAKTSEMQTACSPFLCFLQHNVPAANYTKHLLESPQT
jgi:hypothetical protein